MPNEPPAIEANVSVVQVEAEGGAQPPREAQGGDAGPSPVDGLVVQVDLRPASGHLPGPPSPLIDAARDR